MLRTIIVLLVLSPSLYSMDTIQVITSDNVKTPIPISHLMECRTLKNVLEDILEIKKIKEINTEEENGDGRTNIHVPTISSEELMLVHRFLKNIVLEKKKDLAHVKKSILKTELKELDTQENLYTLLRLADYFNARPLLKKCIKLWAKANYLPTTKTPLPLAHNYQIARRMKRTKKLLDESALWVAHDVLDRNATLLEHTISPEPSSVWCAAFSSDARLLAGGHHNGIISIFDVFSDEIRLIDTQQPEISTVQFSPDNRQIASSNDTQSIKVWDIASGELIEQYHSPLCKGFTFRHIPQHNLLVTDGQAQKVCAWDLSNPLETPQILEGHTGHILAIEAAQDGSYFASAANRGTRLWKSSDRKLMASFEYNVGAMSTAFNQATTKLVCGLNNGGIIMHDLTTENTILNTQEHKKGVWSAVFADTGDTLLCSGGVDGMVMLWDLRSRKPIMVFHDHVPEPVHYLAVNMHEQILSSASEDMTLKIWDLRKLISPIHERRNEFYRKTTIEQICLLHDADKSEEPLNLDIPIRKKIFQRYSDDAQRLLLKNLPMQFRLSQQ